MKTIKVRYIRILNFKGIRDKRIEFSDRTEIRGANATGKTTVFDAFLWCLFDKDSTDRQQFSIKTRDASGAYIPKLPHEVEVCLEVDGNEVVLCRKYNEKWKNLGSPNEKFMGNEEERIFNGVPVSVAEWKVRLNGIIDEDIFKYVTNPFYFTSQKPNVQRCLLFRMSGGLTDADIAAQDVRFRALLHDMGGKAMEDYRRETKAKLDRVTKEKESLPARIDERRRDAVAPEDWDALEARHEALKTELANVDATIRDKARAISEASKIREDAARDVSLLKKQVSERRREITGKAEAAYNAKVLEKAGISRELESAVARQKYCEKKIQNCEDFIRDEEAKRGRLLEEYKSINEEKLIFNENDFACPACGRMLEADDIEGKKREMEERFNADKSWRIASNIERGKRSARQIEDYKAQIDEQNRLLENEEQSIFGLKERLAACNPVEPEYDGLVAEDSEYARLSKELQVAQKRLEELPEAVADDELQERKRGIVLQLEEARYRIAKREMIEANNRRIMELENMLRANSEEEVRLKGILDAITEFGKTRARMLSDKVNGLFSIVKFKLFDTLVNGEEVEVCEATVNGVPYSDVNAAGKVLAGLDIIIALQRHIGMAAPVFIDEAESITDYKGTLESIGQVITMRVTEDKELMIS